MARTWRLNNVRYAKNWQSHIYTSSHYWTIFTRRALSSSENYCQDTGSLSENLNSNSLSSFVKNVLYIKIFSDQQDFSSSILKIVSKASVTFMDGKPYRSVVTRVSNTNNFMFYFHFFLVTYMWIVEFVSTEINKKNATHLFLYLYKQFVCVHNTYWYSKINMGHSFLYLICDFLNRKYEISRINYYVSITHLESSHTVATI